MKSDPRLNWHFESSSRYSGLSRRYRVRLIDFPDHLVVNWAYSSRRRRVLLVNYPDRLAVIRLVVTEFVWSTRETDSSRITPLRLVKCRVRLVELWDRLVVDQFHLQISKKYPSWEGPRTWFSCKMAAHLASISKESSVLTAARSSAGAAVVCKAALGKLGIS